MKIYIIKSTLVEKEKGLNRNNVWSNVFAVKTEEDARKDCIRIQNESNNSYLGKSFKFVYIYEEVNLY